VHTRRFFTIGLAAVSSLACAATPETEAAGTRRTSSALAGGVIDPDTAAVFALEVTAPNPALCSAVLVAPNLLLTARHCVSVDTRAEVVCGQSPLDGLVAPEAVVIDNVLSYLDAPRPSEPPLIARFEVPPNGSDTCGYDLAAVVLDRNLVATPPLLPRLVEPPELGERYTAVGYGESTANAGSRAGLRMRLEDQVVSCLGGDCAVPMTASEFGGGDGVCLGDSGGPAIDAEGRVFGIASRSAAGCETPVYTSLPAFADWLDPLLDEAAELGGYDRAPLDPPPEPPEEEPTTTTTSSAPPPPSWAQLGDACTAELACEPELACVYETTPDDARCRERCDDDSDCPGAQTCDQEASVCWEPPKTGNADCSFSPARTAPAWPLSLLVLGGVAIWRRRRSQDALATCSLLAAAGIGGVAGCGNDLSPSDPRRPIVIEPAAAQGGAADQGGAAGAGGAEGGASGAPSDSMLADALGRACGGSEDCPSELTCLSDTSYALAYGSPPGGVCSFDCDDSALDCAAVGGRCVDFAGSSFCMQRCAFGRVDKCHGRDDFACEPTYRHVEVSCDVDDDCGSSAVCRNGDCHIVYPLCLPRCNGSADCPAPTACDPVSGECVDTAPSGNPVGSACDPSASRDECRGVCLASGSDTEGRCHEFCTLGVSGGCGADADCVLVLDSAPGSAPGDIGACATRCSCDAPCADGLACVSLEGSASDTAGYCSSATATLDCTGGRGGAPAGL